MYIFYFIRKGKITLYQLHQACSGESRDNQTRKLSQFLDACRCTRQEISI